MTSKSGIFELHQMLAGMPKTPSDKLFRLVKSLSGSEKRYFRLFAGPSATDRKYLSLFEAIEVQKTFDDEALRKAVYGDQPVESRKYSELKAYLYGLILKSLQAYDENSSVDYRLKKMLLNVRTLFRRALYDDCHSLLLKARKLAERYEAFHALLEIYHWKKHLAYTRTDIAFLDRELQNIRRAEEHCLQQLDNILQYRHLFYELLVSIRKDPSRNPQRTQTLLQLLQTPLLQEPHRAASHTARILRLRILTLLHYSTSRFQDFYTASRELLRLMESRPHLLEESLAEYISALNNHVVSCGLLEKFGEVEATLEKFRRLKPKTRDDALKIHRQYFMNKFRLCINTGAFDEGVRALEEHLREVERFDPAQFDKSNFYLQYFCLYFGAQDYDRALDSLNRWLGMSKNVERQDLQSLARMLNLIMHFELGNTLLLDSLIRSTYRFLNRENRLSPVERSLLRFMKFAVKNPPRKDLRQALENLRQELESLRHHPAFAAFQMFDVLAWLDGKIQGRPFAEIVREKHRRRLQPSDEPSLNG